MDRAGVPIRAASERWRDPLRLRLKDNLSGHGSNHHRSIHVASWTAFPMIARLRPRRAGVRTAEASHVPVAVVSDVRDIAGRHRPSVPSGRTDDRRLTALGGVTIGAGVSGVPALRPRPRLKPIAGQAADSSVPLASERADVIAIKLTRMIFCSPRGRMWAHPASAMMKSRLAMTIR